MENIKTLLEKEFRMSQEAVQMIAQAKDWNEQDMLKFSKLSAEISYVRKKLATNPNFHSQGNGLMN